MFFRGIIGYFMVGLILLSSEDPTGIKEWPATATLKHSLPVSSLPFRV